MHRALVILCVLCTASLLVTVKAQPGRMRILPGLTFYNSDDSIGGGGGGGSSLNDEDRNLLNTVLKIISRPEMQRVLEDLQTTLQTQGENGNGMNGNGMNGMNGNGMNGMNGNGLNGNGLNGNGLNGNGNGLNGNGLNGNGLNGNGLNGNGLNGNGLNGNGNGLNGNGLNGDYMDSPMPYVKPGNGNGNGGGMPIATINVYPGYPGGSQAMTDASRRMVHYPKTPEVSPADSTAEGYGDDTVSGANPADNGYGMSRKYTYLGDTMNEVKDTAHPYNADDVFANQNYPPPNDNYFEGSSSLHQILPALDRRSLSKLDQKEEFTNTQQLADKLGQRRMMQYEKPNPGNHFSPFMFPTH